MGNVMQMVLRIQVGISGEYKCAATAHIIRAFRSGDCLDERGCSPGRVCASSQGKLYLAPLYRSSDVVTFS